MTKITPMPATTGFAALNQADFNCLPRDGEVNYHGPIVTPTQADMWLEQLHKEIDWQADQAVIFGKHITTRRKIAWHGDQAFAYTYSKITRQASSWTPLLREIKALVEQHSGAHYNACLLNLYHDGADGMAWHSDAERDLERHGAIASVSLGAQRRFGFKHKASAETLWMELEHGSLLVMRGSTQDHWLHRLPPTKRIDTMRINLTFRSIRPQD